MLQLTPPSPPRRDPLEYPIDDVHARSIVEPTLLGQTPTGRILGASLRRNNAYIWGRKGAGKTTLLNTMVAGVLQCSDSLIWMSGAYTAAPWLRTFGDGTTDVPAIDWVASDVGETVEMLEAAVRLCQYRAMQLVHRATAGTVYEDGDGLPVMGTGRDDQAGPHILIVLDDDMLRFADRDLPSRAEHAFARLAVLGTRAGVTFVKTGLRVHDRPQDRTGIEIGMRLAGRSEIFEAFGSAGENLLPVSAAGTGHAQLDYGAPYETFQAFWMRPEWLPGLAEKTSMWRPKMTFDDRFSLGDGYRSRWKRTAPALWKSPRREIREYDAV